MNGTLHLVFTFLLAEKKTTTIAYIITRADSLLGYCKCCNNNNNKTYVRNNLTSPKSAIERERQREIQSSMQNVLHGRFDTAITQYNYNSF